MLVNKSAATGPYRHNKTTAVAAIPLPCPTQPSFSVVVALMLILFSPTFKQRATFLRIVA